MNLHEYQAKDILRRYGIPVPKNIPLMEPKGAKAAAQKLIDETGLEVVVVKAQIHAGGRGKAGGVKLAKTLDQVREYAKAMLGTKMETYQTAGVEPGDSLSLVLPDGGSGEYTVAGVFDLGAAAANDRQAFLDAGSVADALGLGEDEFSAIEIQVDDVFASTEVAGRLAADGIEVIDWQTENEELLSGLAAQSGSSIMIQAFVLVAVALGIASTLAINAVQKTRQIGILKAMGMTDAASGRIFLLQALILGVAGVALGVVFGYVLIWGFSFAPVDFEVRPSPGLILISVAVGIAVALASSIIPSRSTSRLDPIEVIQSA